VVEGEIAPEPIVEQEVAAEELPPSGLPLPAWAAVIIVLGLWLGLRLGRWFQNWRQAWLESESAAFHQANRALRKRDPQAISAAVMGWLDRLDPGTRPARLDLFLEDHGDEQTRVAAAMLARSMATDGRFEESRALARGLKRARRHFLRSLRAKKIAAGALPELNGGPPLTSDLGSSRL
jgi:hypothetical protein